MLIDTLEDLYLEQLKDIYSANELALDVTQEMADAATDQDLALALKAVAADMQNGIAALEAMGRRHDESVTGKLCKGMKGLATEARAHALEQSFGENATRDAMIIAQYQRLAHYAIAGYGCLAGFADQLELDGDLESLKNCLNASYDGDRIMTEFATGGINNNAVVLGKS